MKTRSIARGIVGSVAALLGVMAAGCSADVSDPQSGEAEIGSTEQAITNGQSLYFGASYKVDSLILNSNNHADNIALWLGGMNSGGTVSTTVGYYDRETDTYTALPKTGGGTVTLPSGLVEPEINEIPGSAVDTAGAPTTRYYLLVGGRSGRDAAAVAVSYVLKLSFSSSQIASGKLTEVKTDAGTGATGTAISQARVLPYRSLKPCGTGSRLIAFGGMTNKGFYTVNGTQTVTNSIEVFTFNSGHDGGDSTWAPLKDTTTPTANTITLQVARGYHEVFDKGDLHTTFYIPGGMTASAKAIASVEKLTVDSDCKATNARSGTNDLPLLTNSMPAARARMASLAIATDSFTDSNNQTAAYEFVIANGNDTGNTRPRDAFLFDVDSEVWSTQSNAIQEGKIFGRFIRSGTKARLVTGIKPHLNSEAADPYYDTSVKVDELTDSSGASHSWASGTDLSTGRLGSAVERLKNGTGALADYVGFGATHTATTGTSPTPSSVQSDFVTF